MKTIDDLGDVRGRRVLVRSDLNVPSTRRTARRSPTTAGSGRRVPTIRRLADAGARVVVVAHLGRPKGAPEPRVLTAPGRRPARRAARRRRCAFAADTVGPCAQRRRPRPPRRRGRPAREPAVQRRARPARTTPSAARSPTSSPRSPTLYVSDGFGVVHRKQASVYDVAQRLPHAAGGLVLAEVEVLRAPHRGPRAALRRSCWAGPRCPTSSASSTTCSARPTASSSAAAWCSPSSPPRATRSAAACSRPTSSTPCAGYLERAGTPAWRSCCRSTWSSPTPSPRTPPHDVVAGGRHPGRPDGPRHRPGVGELFAERLADARTVFWNGPMGVFEFDAVQPPARAPSPRPSPRSRALTVVGGGDSAAAVRTLGLRRGRFRAHLDRRWRQPGVPRGQDPSRASPYWRTDAMAETSSSRAPR